MTDKEETNGNGRDAQRGPWLLALGALAIGVLAFLGTVLRSIVRRLRGDDGERRADCDAGSSARR